MKKIHKKILSVLIGVVEFVGSFSIGNAADFEEWYVNVSGLNCRTEPNDKSQIITTYNRGKVLRTIGGSGWWLQVYDADTNTYGWCYGKYMKPYNGVDNSISSHDYLGNFRISYYTCSSAENGGWNVTSTGHKLTDVVGTCIAVDPRVIPYGTKVYIENVGYRVAMDCGGAIKGNKIDVLVRNKNEIPDCGVHYSNVYIVNN